MTNVSFIMTEEDKIIVLMLSHRLKLEHLVALSVWPSTTRFSGKFQSSTNVFVFNFCSPFCLTAFYLYNPQELTCYFCLCFSVTVELRRNWEMQLVLLERNSETP